MTSVEVAGHNSKVVDEPDAAALGARFDNPEAYIPRDRRRALSRGTAMPDRVRGAGLFADVSGFTPLTEALAAELGPQRGAEVLTAILDDVISAVIADLDRYGGDVIYFSGDAITGWVDGDDGSRATTAALAMQATMARVGSVTTPGGTAITLAMKVAIAVGPARRFVVGLPSSPDGSSTTSPTRSTMPRRAKSSSTPQPSPRCMGG